MARRWTGGGVPQAVTHGTQLLDCLVEFVGFGGELIPINPWLSVGREHFGNLVERETGGAPQCDQRQTYQHARGELATQPAPTNGCYQSTLLVVAERRGRYTGSPSHFRNI